MSTFTFSRLVRDALILVSALGHKSVSCILGHDFGAVAASMCALMRPDVFKSSVPPSKLNKIPEKMELIGTVTG